MWPKARRAVNIETSRQIADIARSHGAQPVAVFVDEDFSDIVKTCKATGIDIAQLHGKGSRKALPDFPACAYVHKRVLFMSTANPVLLQFLVAACTL